MSSKNLKVYKMKFITELRKLTMNVKFACKIKATWKRSTVLLMQAVRAQRALGSLCRGELLILTKLFNLKSICTSIQLLISSSRRK